MRCWLCLRGVWVGLSQLGGISQACDLSGAAVQHAGHLCAKEAGVNNQSVENMSPLRD